MKVKCKIEINIRENRRGNQEWTIGRNWLHWVHKTQDEKTQHRNLKKMSNTEPH